MTTSKTILAIDDDDGIREIIQFSLEATTDWEILTATSGKEGLAIAAEAKPDAILLDVMMPDLDGIATFARLQKNPTTRDIPTILLTAKAKMSEQKQFIDIGVTGVITKPFTAVQLLEEMKKILQW